VGTFDKWLNDLKDDDKRMLGSIYAIAKRATAAGHPIHPGTVAKYLKGEGAKEPPEHTIRALAAGFKVTEQEVRDNLGMPQGESGPWYPPEESARLNRDQRSALDLLIKAIARPVIEPLPAGEPEVSVAGTGNEVPPEVDAAQQVSEDRASRQRRSPGPGARRSTRKRKPKTDAPPATSTAQDNPISPVQGSG
jgi:hypothetical protein